MIEKLLNSLFWLSDLFERRRRCEDPILEEKRARERRIVMSVFLSLLLLVPAFVLKPDVWTRSPMDPVAALMTARAYVSLAFGGGAFLAALWSVIEMVWYWRFLRREGLY